MTRKKMRVMLIEFVVDSHHVLSSKCKVLFKICS